MESRAGQLTWNTSNGKVGGLNLISLPTKRL